MTPAEAIARADRDSAATLARLGYSDAVIAEFVAALDYTVPAAMVENRVPLRHNPDILRRLLADTERDLYLETVAARGIDPLNQRREAADKDAA